MKQVKRFLHGIIVVTLLLTLGVPQTRASSEQAYRDFQYQFDVYRQRLADFQIAMTQYKQFNSLASQQEALDRVKLVLAQRGDAAKTYFLFLNEKLTENPGLASGELSIYRAILTNQVGYLDQHIVLAPSVASMEDARTAAEQFEKNYETMQSAYRQVIAAVELGYLNYFAEQFDTIALNAQALIASGRSDASPQKQAVLDRWLLTLSNKHSLYQQKASVIRSTIPKITGDVREQDRVFLALQTKFGEARQDLVESAAYLKELETALKYE